MNYQGKLVLTQDNKYGVFDSKKGAFVDLDKEFDYLRNSKVHIIVSTDKGNELFNSKGHISSRKVGKGLYDTYIGEEVTALKNENNNVLEGDNLTECLFDNVGKRLIIKMKELVRGLTEEESEDIK